MDLSVKYFKICLKFDDNLRKNDVKLKNSHLSKIAWF